MTLREKCREVARSQNSEEFRKLSDLMSRKYGMNYLQSFEFFKKCVGVRTCGTAVSIAEFDELCYEADQV